jgi:hypothetical protein
MCPLEGTSMKSLLLALAAVASPIFAQTPQSAAVGTKAGGASFVPADFSPPKLVETPGFKLVPLGPDVLQVDYDAYMSSIAHLQKTFTRSTGWPRAGITHADAVLDMQTEQARFTNRKAFDYSVLTPDGRRERGSVYITPSPLAGYDAVVRLWVTKAEYDAGFDASLYAWVQAWVQKDWPFRKVAYPGRSIDWKTWDSMVAANASKQAAAGAKSP